MDDRRIPDADFTRTSNHFVHIHVVDYSALADYYLLSFRQPVKDDVTRRPISTQISEYGFLPGQSHMIGRLESV